MRLLLRVRGSAGRVDDVAVTVDPLHTVDELAATLARHLGEPHRPDRLTVARTGRPLPADAAVATCDLLWGDEVTLTAGTATTGAVTATTGTAPRPPADRHHDQPGAPGTSLVADVVAGPDTGRSFALGPGRWTVGRAADATLRIDDPAVSRHHLDLELELGDGPTVTVHPMPGATNAVVVDGRPVDTATAVTALQVITLGATGITVRRVDAPRHRSRFGQVDFRRTPYRPPVVAERRAEPVGPIPQRPAPRRLQVASAVAPLVGGVALFAFTRQTQFLALTLLSPAIVLATWIEDRRSGRRAFADQVAEFRADLAAQRARLVELRDAERRDLVRLAPDLADLIRRAERRTADLWARDPGAPDFLRLRVGLGPARVRYALDVAPGGDPDLRAEAHAALDGLDRLDDVPVTVELGATAVLGVTGDPWAVDRVAASLVVQAATLHSPDHLVIAAAVHRDRPFGWLAWLPHVHAATSPLAGAHLADERPSADGLVRRLADLAEARPAGRPAAGRPHLLVLLDAELHLAPTEVARLLGAAPGRGVSVIWLARSLAAVPHFARRTLAVHHEPGAGLVGRLDATDPATPQQMIAPEQLRPGFADRAARALAAVCDASAAAAAIATTAGLLDVIGADALDPAAVARRWCDGRHGHLRFPIGVGAGGVVELDLVGDGPHTLIGGTSGSGKSELLQAMVAALAVHHPPTRLNVLFVDYKGGAATQAFAALPHTVGVVTDLHAGLATRALTSLRAELRRRMALLDGRAKDLAELAAVAPHDTPPSLVIVVDEFATLVREVPDFVDGVVDIAQRGRSLGIHLVLATQRPTGSVNDNILANTNIRIALRMLDTAESTAIIGCADAAAIPVSRRGRALVRIGTGRPVEFQSAFGGAPTPPAAGRAPVLVTALAAVGPTADLQRDHLIDDHSASRPPATATQLAAVVAAVRRADRLAGHPPARRPWCDPLPELVTLDDLDAFGAGDPDVAAARALPGRFVAVGLVDLPDQQAQRVGVIDLEAGGGLLVFGCGGSGATTVLRTVATWLDRTAPPGAVATVAFDFGARGLAGLQALGSVVGVAAGDDLEAVTRHLTVLDAELTRRRATAHPADRPAAPRDPPPTTGRTAPPRIVVLIDGFAGLVAGLLEPGGRHDAAAGRWCDLIVRLVLEGRQVGIHTVITADRRAAVPARLTGAIANRLILRHADDGAYVDHGIASTVSRHLDLPPGRGLLDATTPIQIATTAAPPAGRVGDRAGHRHHTALAGVALPAVLALADVPPAGDPGPCRIPIGVVDVTGDAAVVDLSWSHLAVSGPPRSGRTTALATVASAARHTLDVVIVGPATGPLSRLGLPRSAFVTAAGAAALATRLAAGRAGADAAPTLVIVDDLDDLDDPVLAAAVDRLAALDPVRLVAAVRTGSLCGYAAGPAIARLRRARRHLLLQPDDPGDFLQATGVRLDLRPGVAMIAGRGVLLSDRSPALVQVATP
ncbi:MAG TPA: FtsK/SpoIIIE domain-containing protein [Ilumatobacter sp.]